MKGKLIRQYTNANGRKVFVYAISGSESQLAEFEASQGQYFRTDDTGNPLFFSIDYHGENAKFGISSKGKVYADTSQIDKISALVSKHEGTQLGAELAKEGARQLLGNLVQTNTPPAVQPSTPESVEQAEEQDAGI